MTHNKFIYYVTHTIDVNRIEDLLSFWKGRLRGTLLDLAILYMAAYSVEKIYPYSIRKKLEAEWQERAPPLPTLYSTIDRLEKNGLIETKKAEIKDTRVKKVITITGSGWDALEAMMEEMKQFLKVFEYHEQELEFPRRKTK